MHAVCAGRDGDVGPRVDQQLRRTGNQGNSLKNLAREDSNIGSGQVFFAELDEIDAVADPARCLSKKRCLLIVFVPRIQGAAGDRITEHGGLSVWWAVEK